MYFIKLAQDFENCRCIQNKIELPKSFDSKEEAKKELDSLIFKMNDEFCGVHKFSYSIDESNFTINVEKVEYNL